MKDLEEMTSDLRDRLVRVMSDVTACAAQASALGVVLAKASGAGADGRASDGPWRLFEALARSRDVCVGDLVVKHDRRFCGEVIEVTDQQARVHWLDDECLWARVDELRVTQPVPSVATSARVSRAGVHERVQLWVRGALAGELTVGEGEAVLLTERLGLVEVGDVLTAGVHVKKGG